MSNKTQLQTNNIKYASLIETLRGKSLPTGGEDVTDETNAYTEKLATLDTAITALETELEGKASGGSGGASVETCTGTISVSGFDTAFVFYTDATFNWQSTGGLGGPLGGSAQISVIKNSLLVYQGPAPSEVIGCETKGTVSSGNQYFYLVTDDNFSITT